MIDERMTRGSYGNSKYIGLYGQAFVWRGSSGGIDKICTELEIERGGRRETPPAQPSTLAKGGVA